MQGFFAGESVPVTRKLSGFFLQLDISEKTGRGVPIVTSFYGKDVYEFRENSIVVSIPFNWIKAPGDKPGNKSESLATLYALYKKNVKFSLANNRFLPLKP